ncbi:MAG: UpxY family transcription antiterminator [Bacteroidota bacterium]|nr:UpxY family transcription antiterminator [Bacteroidota bacterium]
MINHQLTITNHQLSYWKALYVASRSEKKVNSSLQELGLESYLPLKTEKKQWSDRKKTVVSPLINGYVFVKTSEQNRDFVFKVANVIQYVRSNGRDAIIREDEIEVLKSIEKKGYFVEGKFGINFKEGETTLITHGPFKGYNGIVKSKASETIYYIAIQSIDYSLTIKVSSEILQKQTDD